MNATGPEDLREGELERRIEELEAEDEAALGRFTTWDWILTVTFAVVLPLIGVWLFAP